MAPKSLRAARAMERTRRTTTANGPTRTTVTATIAPRQPAPRRRLIRLLTAIHPPSLPVTPPNRGGHTARISPSASRRMGRTSFPMPILGRIRTSGEPSPAMAMRRITRLKFPTPSRRRLNVTLPPPADVQGRRFAPEGAGQAALELAGLGLPFAARDAAPLAPPAAADG